MRKSRRRGVEVWCLRLGFDVSVPVDKDSGRACPFTGERSSVHVLGVPSRVAGNLAIILSGGGLEKGLKMEAMCKLCLFYYP